MRIIPAIDLRGGRCVRLLQGDYGRETVFGDDPLAMARRWAEQGAEILHVVDLDGARAGESRQLAVAVAISRATGLPVQLGGGLRTRAAVAEALNAGIERVVLGTAAVNSPDLVRELVAAYGPRLVVGIDARAGKAAVGGWLATTGKNAFTLAKEMQDCGVEEIIYTDIQRDGMLSGPDIAGLRMLLALGLRVNASGGVGTLADIRELKALEAAGLTGVIIGQALYTGRIELSAAIRVAGGRGEQDAG